MDDPNEQWRIIADWPHYEVSSFGNVRRGLHTQIRTNTRPGRFLKPYIDHDGYRRVRLCGENGARITLIVHRLVGMAFVDGFHPDLVAAHKDGNLTNNSAGNIVWVTQAENIDHKRLHGTTARGERIRASKLAADDVRAILRNYSGRRGQKAAFARQYGVSETAIGKIISRQHWGHVHAD